MRLALKHQILLAPASVLLLLTLLLGFLQYSYWNLSVTRQKVRQLGSVYLALAQADLTAARMQSLARRFQLLPLVDLAEAQQMTELSGTLIESLSFISVNLPLSLASESLLRQSITTFRSERALEPNQLLETLATLRPQLVTLSEEVHKRREALTSPKNLDIDELVHKTAFVSILVLGAAIFLGILLSLFFARRILNRVQALSASASRIAAGDLRPPEAPAVLQDELDQLSLSINRMTEKLIRVVAAEKLLEGAEEERRRIAMDLHDQTLADLAAVQRGLQEMKNLPCDAQRRDAVEEDLQRAIAGLREVMEDLHPQTLDILGLGAALTSHLERLHTRPGLPEYSLLITPAAETLAIPRLFRLALYRIALETIHNVIKHARASRYEITLETRDSRLVLAVEDNGTGFDPAAISGTGRGLHNIRERARAIHAETAWGPSRFTSGTRFELRLPLSVLASPQGG